MRMIALERQARAHDEWMVVLTAVAQVAYQLIDNPSAELLAELKGLRAAERAAKYRFEMAMCDAMTEGEAELLTETVELADADQVTAQIPREVLNQLVRESSK